MMDADVGRRYCEGCGVYYEWNGEEWMHPRNWYDLPRSLEWMEPQKDEEE